MAITQFDLLFFVLERTFTHFWWAQAVILGGHSLEMPARGTGPVTFFRDTILLGGEAHFSLAGHKQ